MNQPLWGIDLGGTKLEGVILRNQNDPTPLIRTRMDTEVSGGYDHVIGQIEKLVAKMESESKLTAQSIGFGTPGILDPVAQTMKNCNATVLNNRPLKKDLEARLKMPVFLANDANCFALAEANWGGVKKIAPRARMVFGIIMGTGVGGGIVIDGKIWDGHHGIGGEWGHNFLDESGGPCYCGKIGCVEKVISGPALQKYYEGLTGEKKSLKEIVALKHQDAAAQQTLNRLAHFFGKAVSVITNILDPDIIVVGGGVGNIDDIYTDGVESLKSFIFNNYVSVPVIRPELGDSAGVFGAAALTNTAGH
ncbi:MAG: ROK family protein [Bacteroidota bacterium]|nr:ROK family protein [Bacteroidota bacterium]MDP4212150.1 ROK family protein [Bacteroidota bacterium]MDP4249034.1 ROK family protein [Bacteroidota bacterium]